MLTITSSVSAWFNERFCLRKSKILLSYLMTLLRSRVPVCIVNYENMPYAYFYCVHIENPLCEFEDSHQGLFLGQFHENLMSHRGLN